ncbi:MULTISPECIES: restriction endonuclease subunit S [unclassified Pseudoalteromonas]|uniref:restriction endonuclease subunit S n=1 Tax=unclassified Pseudoalteromonas TaxID=194690 RepID=UPI001601D18A|nr:MULTISPECIES: restriction endonuclease subunit S [unclassified Pseudoalteromonas]MBB1351519.1 restriction endonuclease subunit S [Pseudoalteromonas sp. SG45-3]MBB1358319.1 restriction endonuclease subunit S [Pseudoalteromonas sp. SG45-6]
MTQLGEIKLPKGWVLTAVQEFCEKITDGSHNPPKAKESGVPMLSAKNISKGKISFDGGRLIAKEDFDIEHKRTRVSIGDVLLTTVATLGRTAVVDKASGKFALQRSVSVLGSEQVDSVFLKYSLDNPEVQSFISMNARGNAQKGFYINQLKELQVKLAPIEEQKRIVEKLDSVLAQVDTIQQRLNNLPDIIKRFRQSVLAAAVSGKLTEQWRGCKDYKTELGTTVPIKWDVKTATEVCEKVQSGSTPRDNPFDQGGKVPFLKVYNIVNQKIDFDYRPQFVTEKVHAEKLKRSVALPGDVLMNIVGPPLGKVAILDDQYPEWNLNQAITLFRADNTKLNKQYLYFVLCEGDLVRKVMPSTKGSVGQVNISLTQCRESTIPLPILEEQTEIVRLVEQYFALADTLEKNLANAKQRVDNLTQSILAKAFRGELVPQDPSDEPADKLLARIKAARLEAEKLEKAAKKAAKTSKK